MAVVYWSSDSWHITQEGILFGLWEPNSRRHSPYTENPYKGTLSFTLTYCIQIEFFNNAAFYALEDGV